MKIPITMQHFTNCLDILTEPEDNPAFICDDEIQELLEQLANKLEQAMLEDPRIDPTAVIYIDATG